MSEHDTPSADAPTREELSDAECERILREAWKQINPGIDTSTWSPGRDELQLIRAGHAARGDEARGKK